MGTRGTGALLGPGLKSLVLVMLSVLVETEAWAKSNDKSDDEERLRQRVDEALELYWQGISGFGLPPGDFARPRDGPRGAATYGEITAMGARVVAHAMGLDAPGGRDLHFVDLGSGVGKLVVQAWLEFPRLASSIGLEISHTRHFRAEKAWKRLREGFAALPVPAVIPSFSFRQNRRGMGVTLERRDMFRMFEKYRYFHSMEFATHMYASSTCFGPEMLKRLATLLAADARSLQVIATLNPFPKGLPGFEMSHSVEAQMSWTVARNGTNTVYIYRRAGSTTGSGSSEL